MTFYNFHVLKALRDSQSNIRMYCGMSSVKKHNDAAVRKKVYSMTRCTYAQSWNFNTSRNSM